MKILYLMHINWQWIRQRPQVFAELLARDHEVRVMHYAMYHRAHRAAASLPPPGSRVLRRIPGRLKRHFSALEYADKVWCARQISTEIEEFQPDLIWATHPDFAPIASKNCSARVIYDCMDDHLEFSPIGAKTLCEAERKIVNVAELTIFSSTTLANRVSRRSPPKRQVVINNGFDGDELPAAIETPDQLPGQFTLGYFGTLSHWFDWPLMLHLLAALPQLHLLLAGPVEGRLPRHPRLRHVGVLGHSDLAIFSAGCHAMTMPFKVTPLISAVDPVKLYEYIALGKPALAPRYAESQRFSPHVTLYDNQEEALEYLRYWSAEPNRIHTLDRARQAFLSNHTWSRRGEQIRDALK